MVIEEEEDFDESLAKGESPGCEIEEIGEDIIFVSLSDFKKMGKKIISETEGVSEHT